MTVWVDILLIALGLGLPPLARALRLRLRGQAGCLPYVLVIGGVVDLLYKLF